MNAAFSSISFLLSVSLQEEISYDNPISLSLHHVLLSFIFSSLFSLSSPSLTPLFLAIFVILLLLLKDNKILGDLRVNRYHP